MAEKWGIWNSIKKEFQFGISEDTPEKARKRLFQKIGKDAYKWRFEVKRMRDDGVMAETHDKRTETHACDLISRQAAVDEKNVVHMELFGRDFPVVSVATLKGLPPVDAVPVRHGRWKTVEDWDGDEYYQCSVCGAEFVLIDGDPNDNDYLYCPHCGAKMDGRTVTMAEKWGIWNSIKKEFQFGISEDTPEKASKRLFQKIGKDAYKWRFKVKRMRGDGNG